MRTFIRSRRVATILLAVGVACAVEQHAHAQRTAAAEMLPPAQTLSHEQVVALEKFAAKWEGTSAVSLELVNASQQSRAELAMRRDGAFAWRWFDMGKPSLNSFAAGKLEPSKLNSQTTASSEPNLAQNSGAGQALSQQLVPDTMLYFQNGQIITRRGVYSRELAASREAHYIATNEVDLWNPPPGPSQMLLAPWPRLARLAKDFVLAGDVQMQLNSETATASSRMLGTTLQWRVRDGRLLSMHRVQGLDTPARREQTPQLREIATYVYSDDATGGLPISIELGAEVPGASSNASVDRWAVTRASTSVDERELTFDAARWNMVRFDPVTSKLHDATGAVIGGELNTSIAGLTDHIEQGRAKSYESLAKWGGIACGLLALGVVVDMIRRRL